MLLLLGFRRREFWFAFPVLVTMLVRDEVEILAGKRSFHLGAVSDVASLTDSVGGLAGLDELRGALEQRGRLFKHKFVSVHLHGAERHGGHLVGAPEVSRDMLGSFGEMSFGGCLGSRVNDRGGGFLGGGEVVFMGVEVSEVDKFLSVLGMVKG